jgi:hypothetical protein
MNQLTRRIVAVLMVAGLLGVGALYAAQSKADAPGLPGGFPNQDDHSVGCG